MTTEATIPATADRFPAPTGGGSGASTLVLAVGPFRDWLAQHMCAHQLTPADVARRIDKDDNVVRAWFGERARDWRSQPPDRFVVYVISELTIEHAGIALTGNPRLVPELYPHMAEPVCQRCGASTDCEHLGHDLQLDQLDDLAA
jgi:hypothetical protein